MASLQDVCLDDELHEKQAHLFSFSIIKMIKLTPERNEVCLSDYR